MSRSILFLAALWLLCASLATAADVTLTRKVQLPDGTPAANLPVRMLVFGNAARDVTLRTDATGTLTVTIPGAELADSGYPQGYLYFSAPGSATVIAKLALPGGSRMSPGGTPMGPPPLPGMPGMLAPGAQPDPNAPLRLPPAFEQPGIVVDNKGNPVAGAIVEISEAQVQPYAGGIPVNFPAENFTIPALSATTAADGTFRLPGLYVESSPGALLDRSLCSVRAAWKAPDDRIWLGGNSRFLIYSKSNTVPDPHGDRWKVEVAPTLSAGGRVVDSVTGKPIKGITVSILANSDLLVGRCLPVKTDDAGRYQFPAVPQGQLLLALAKPQGDQYSAGWVQLTEQGRFGTDPEAKPGAITARDMELRPMIEFKGTLRDKTTGKAPSFPMLLTVEYGERFSEGTNWGDLVYQPPACTQVVPPSGEIDLRVPVGDCRVGLTAPGYGVWFGQEFIAANPRMTFSVPRREGILFQFITANPRGYQYLKIDLKDKVSGVTSFAPARNFQPDGRWFFDTKESKVGPDAKWQVQVSRDGRVVIPWSPVDANAWPVVVNIP